LNLRKSMYEPVAYSPVTSIKAAIGAGDTTITVDNGALLGNAPNIAVIGASSNLSETIVYGDKNGNVLSNVQRGVQGTAKSWSVGDPISRNFTALDQSNMQDNINALNASKINMPIPLEENIDLNNITTPGMYVCTSNDIGETIANNPITSWAKAFSLFVERTADGGDSFYIGTKQTLTCYFFEMGLDVTYTRNGYAGSWGNWHQLAYV